MPRRTQRKQAGAAFCSTVEPTVPPSSAVLVTREHDRYRIECYDVVGRRFVNRLSPQFSTVALRRTWAIQQAERHAAEHYLRWDEVIRGEGADHATT